MPTALILLDIAIRQDEAGRFCLNDLHRAAGGEKRHGPSYWLDTKQTAELIKELETTGIPVVCPVSVTEGRNGGTYIVKELVYAYAMWVSATFHLKVIRAYDAMIHAPQPQPAELSREQILVMALDSERERVRLATELEKVQPMVQFHEEVAQAEGEFTIDETCTALFNGAVSVKELRNWLRRHDWLDSRPKVNRPTDWAVHRGFMRLRVDTVNRRAFMVPVLTANGLELLRHLYRSGQLFTACIPAECLLAAPHQAA